MKEVKFAHRFGEKKLSVAYYEDKRLKKVKGIEKNIYPIYIRITFDKVTLRIRSILWKRLVETNEFQFSVIVGNNKKIDTLAQGYADIESTFIKNRTSFEQICEYEFECIKRIIVFATQTNPQSVQQIVNAYNFWGQDGLREISKTIIQKIIDYDHGTQKIEVTEIFEVRKYPPISRNLFKFINSAIDNYDPVSLICILDEIDLVEKNGVKGQLLTDYNRLVHFIGSLLFEFAFYKTKPRPLSLGIMYMPKIHFFYPLSDDFSQRTGYNKPGEDPIKVIDFLLLKSYLSLADQ